IRDVHVTQMSAGLEQRVHVVPLDAQKRVVYHHLEIRMLHRLHERDGFGNRGEQVGIRAAQGSTSTVIFFAAAAFAKRRPNSVSCWNACSREKPSGTFQEAPALRIK